MIQSIEVTNDLGETLVIPMRNPEQSGFFIKNIQGLGPVKSNINMTEVLTIPGGLYNSAHLTTRNIVIELGFYDDGSESIENIRLKSYRYFPISRKCQIKINTDIRSALTEGYVETNEPSIFTKDSGTSISIICPKSYFISADIYETIFSTVVPLFEFPFENPSLTEPLIEFGDIILAQEKSVLYNGEVETGVILVVDFLGDVTNPSFFNLTTYQEMSILTDKLVLLTGDVFIAGDRLIISTIKGSKSITLVREGEEINILNALDRNASWFLLQRGDNLFYYDADTGVSNMQVQILHNVFYEGM